TTYQGEAVSLSYHRDITERKHTEEALRESGVKFRDLYDNAPVGYFEYDAQGRITNVNRTELEMLGYTLDEMIGQPVWKFIMEDVAQDQILAKLAGTIPSEREFERTYRRKNGSILPVLAEDRLLRDSEGRIAGIRCTIQDITERKRSEEEKASLQEQLRQSQKIEAIGRLSGGIAHDFNNILTIISGNAQLSLLDLKQGDPLRANIVEIKGASERAADLTRQLLAFSRKQMMEMKVLDLNLIVQGLDKMLHRLLGEDIDLVTVLPEGIGKVKADPGQIEQVIVNLAVNARDAMIEGGKLTIETADVELDEEYARKHIAVIPGRYVMLSVSDTGVGMTSEVKDWIFEPFFTTKQQGTGTGLGLSSVYGIVKQSGGNIWVYSEPGQGTTFKIYLPQVDEPLTEEKQEVIKEIPRG
ncbi:MAG: PAS domain S-box protein, partial [Deltaproteobacteria bacterium]|nr:PAS domain S-box protein [Deltaproteobacteria bacterium]